MSWIQLFHLTQRTLVNVWVIWLLWLFHSFSLWIIRLCCRCTHCAWIPHGHLFSEIWIALDFCSILCLLGWMGESFFNDGWLLQYLGLVNIETSPLKPFRNQLESILVCGLKSNSIRYWLIAPINFVSLLHRISFRQVTIVDRYQCTFSMSNELYRYCL